MASQASPYTSSSDAESGPADAAAGGGGGGGGGESGDEEPGGSSPGSGAAPGGAGGCVASAAAAISSGRSSSSVPHEKTSSSPLRWRRRPLVRLVTPRAVRATWRGTPRSSKARSGRSTRTCAKQVERGGTRRQGADHRAEEEVQAVEVGGGDGCGGHAERRY